MSISNNYSNNNSNNNNYNKNRITNSKLISNRLTSSLMMSQRGSINQLMNEQESKIEDINCLSPCTVKYDFKLQWMEEGNQEFSSSSISGNHLKLPHFQTDSPSFLDDLKRALMEEHSIIKKDAELMIETAEEKGEFQNQPRFICQGVIQQRIINLPDKYTHYYSHLDRNFIATDLCISN